MNTIRTILGLDPGLRHTGWGVLARQGNRLSFVAAGRISPDAGLPMAGRLYELACGLAAVVRSHQPDEAAIEETFINKNAVSALKLGQARGAALSATFANRPRVYEYAPREVKLAVVGTGAAQKEQVQLMVKRLLNIAGPLAEDAADALAIAMCHAHSRRLQGLVSLAVGAVR